MQKVKILKNHYQQITKTSKVKKRGEKKITRNKDKRKYMTLWEIGRVLLKKNKQTK